jgi:radical SAM protein with 4Fe4S-binding SPASM domain
VTEYPKTPQGWTVLDRRSIGPFITAVTYAHPDDSTVHWSSRVHRKHASRLSRVRLRHDSVWWAPPRQRAFGAATHDTLPSYCRSCDVRFACNGGCPKDRFLLTPNGEPGLHYLCGGYQLFFRHVDTPMPLMAALLRQGQDATGLRDWYATADAGRSPAEPCTCRSGRPPGSLPRPAAVEASCSAWSHLDG